MQALGKHVLLDLNDCNVELLDDVGFVRETLLLAAREIGATIMGETFHHFQPYGVSGIVIIAESHLSIHTWPENAYAAIDVFTCRELVRPEKAVDLVIERFQAKNHSIVQIGRGVFVAERCPT